MVSLAEDWSIFRPTDMFCEQTFGRKHGPAPFPPSVNVFHMLD